MAIMTKQELITKLAVNLLRVWGYKATKRNVTLMEMGENSLGITDLMVGIGADVVRFTKIEDGWKMKVLQA